MIKDILLLSSLLLLWPNSFPLPFLFSSNPTHIHYSLPVTFSPLSLSSRTLLQTFPYLIVILFAIPSLLQSLLLLTSHTATYILCFILHLTTIAHSSIIPFVVPSTNFSHSNIYVFFSYNPFFLWFLPVPTTTTPRNHIFHHRRHAILPLLTQLFPFHPPTPHPPTPSSSLLGHLPSSSGSLLSSSCFIPCLPNTHPLSILH